MFLLAFIAVLELRVEAFLVGNKEGRDLRVGSCHVEQDGQKNNPLRAWVRGRVLRVDLFMFASNRVYIGKTRDH